MNSIELTKLSESSRKFKTSTQQVNCHARKVSHCRKAITGRLSLEKETSMLSPIDSRGQWTHWTQSGLTELMSPVTIFEKSGSKVGCNGREVAHDWKGISTRLYLVEETNLLFPIDSRESFVLLNSIYCMSPLENWWDYKIAVRSNLDTFHRLWLV